MLSSDEHQLRYSTVESERFDLRVFRDGVVEHLDADRLRRELSRHEADVYIFRMPVEQQTELYRLNEIGYPFIVADTLVYYTCPLSTYAIRPPRNSDLDFETCREADVPTLNRLTSAIFERYQNHYASNPAFDRHDVMEGYKEWVRSYVQSVGSERSAFLVSRAGETIGFATCSFDTNAGVSEGVLYGVMPHASGGGVYSDIIRFTQDFSLKNGFSTMRVSTQIQNYAVQKVWAREGFHLTDAYITIHINSMLGSRESKAYKRA